MKDHPLVSIVTPSRNMGKFIEKCIESVMAQDYPNVEHIIQDGASADGTIDILKRYDGRIKWVSEPDNGQSDGLNKALQRCKGDIILVLNADDELLPHACSWGVEQMLKYPDAAVIYGDQYNVDEKGKMLSRHFGPRPYNFKQVFCVEEIIPAQASFVRRTYFEKVGFYIDASLATCPDYELWTRIGLKYQLKHVKGYIAKYRHHSGSEGRNPGMVPKMIEAKKKIQERILCDPSTPPDIIRLQSRARSGLLYWEATLHKYNGHYREAFKKMLRSIFIYPSLKKIVNLLKLLPGQVRWT